MDMVDSDRPTVRTILEDIWSCLHRHFVYVCFTVFDMRTGKDENGNPIEVKVEFESGIIR